MVNHEMVSHTVSRTFGVFLQCENSEAVRFERVKTASRILASKMAEAMNPGFRSTAVTMRDEIVGYCRICQAPIFADERPRETNRGLSCFDC